MTTMPPVVIKGYLTAFQRTTATSPYVINMNAGTTGTALSTDDYVLIWVSAGGSAAVSEIPTLAGFTEIIPWGAVGTSTSTMSALYARKRLASDGNYTLTYDASGAHTGLLRIEVFWLEGGTTPLIAQWVLGIRQSRATSGGTVTNIAPSVAVLDNNTSVWALSIERTTASEVDSNLTVSGTGWTKQKSFIAAAIDCTLTIATKGMPTPGASGDATFTTTNTQSTNGEAFQIMFPPIPVGPPTFGPLHTAVGDYRVVVSSPAVNDITISIPPNTAVGDLLICALSTQSNQSAAIIESTGTWTLVSAPISLIDGKRPSGIWILPVHDLTAIAATYSWHANAAGRWVVDMFRFTGADLTNPIAGISAWDSNPATSGSYTTAVIPTFSTATDGAMIIAHAHATNTATQLHASWNPPPSGMTLFSDQATSKTDTVSSDALALWSKIQNIAGNVGTLTAAVTNPLGQSILRANAISIRPGGVGPSGLPGHLWSGSSVTSGHWYVTGPADTIEGLQWTGAIWPGYSSVTQMLAQTTFYCSHRGGSRNYPEMSLQAYTQSALRGYGSLEISLARTSDGVWFGLHDASLDRTSMNTGGGSGTTYVASTMTWADVQTHDIMNLNGITAVNSNHEPYMRLEEILDAYMSSHVLFIDPKAALSFRAELIAILKNRHDWQNKIVAKYVPGNNTNSWLTDARAAGFATNAMFYATDTAPNYAQADILGMEYTASQPVWDTILAPGKPVMCHVCPDSASITTGIGRGARGAMVSGIDQVRLVTFP